MLCSKEIQSTTEFIKILKEFNKSAYGEIYLSGLHMWTDFKLFGIGLNNFYKVCINEKNIINIIQVLVVQLILIICIYNLL